jgi:hypothetical protein
MNPSSRGPNTHIPGKAKSNKHRMLATASCPNPPATTPVPFSHFPVGIAAIHSSGLSLLYTPDTPVA